MKISQLSRWRQQEAAKLGKSSLKSRESGRIAGVAMALIEKAGKKKGLERLELVREQGR